MSPKLRLTKFLLMAAVCGFFLSAAQASTYYIDDNGSDSGSGTDLSPWRTLDKVWTVDNSGGDTIIIKNGTYDYAGMEIDGNVPSGSAGAYTVIKAENDGGAVFTLNNALQMRYTSTPLQQYIQIEGFKFSGTYEKRIYGTNIKFLRCAFKGGPSSGNAANTTIGGNDNGANLATYILMEDCWFYGAGGRYKLMVFNTEHVVLRRVTIRDDAGWNDSPNTGNPEACLAWYNSSEGEIQDVVLIDSNLNYYEYTQAFYYIRNTSANPDHVANNVNVRGMVILNSKEMCIRADANGITGVAFSDVATADCQNGMLSYGGSTSINVSVTRYGTTKISMTQSGDFQGGIGHWGSGTVSATNGIVANQSGADFDGVSPTYFDTYNNGSNLGSGTGRQTYNPHTNGWLYPVRIEAASNLLTAGSGGGQMGPKITTKIGTSGTLHGETGYATDTGEALWPWPYEARIKTDFSEIAARNWTASTNTLTEYIWQYFGNTIPASVYGADTSSPTAAGTPTVTSTNTTSLAWSWSAATDNVAVTGYRYDLATDSGFSSLVVTNQDNGNSTTATTSGLNSATQYWIRVRAYDAAGNTGSNSTAGTGTTSTPPSSTVAPELRFGTGGFSAPAGGGWRRLP
jgi:hypothetical protein